MPFQFFKRLLPADVEQNKTRRERGRPIRGASSQTAGKIVLSGEEDVAILGSVSQ